MTDTDTTKAAELLPSNAENILDKKTTADLLKNWNSVPSYARRAIEQLSAALISASQASSSDIEANDNDAPEIEFMREVVRIGRKHGAIDDVPFIEWIEERFNELSRLKRASRTSDGASNGEVKRLEWIETFVDRGDGGQDQSGFEADSCFGWYSIEMYFGSDSYGWQVKFDCEVIADKDDPDDAKAAGQADFDRRIRSVVSISPANDDDEIVRDAWRYRRLQVLGAAPDGSKNLENGTVLRWSTLDAFIDEDKRVVPSRGEFSGRKPAAPPSQARTSDGGDGAVAVQDEWVLVPVEPTEAMARASRLIINLPDNVRAARVTEWGVKSWSAMLAAAPPAPIPSVPDETNERLREAIACIIHDKIGLRELFEGSHELTGIAQAVDAIIALFASSSKEGGL